MPFTKGQSKPEGSGRKPGSRNIYKLPKLEESVIELRLNPLRELLSLLPDLDPRDQADVWLKLLPFMYAKKKEEHKAPSDMLDITPQFAHADSDTLLNLVNGNSRNNKGEK